MMKAIFAMDVKAGDYILISGSERWNVHSADQLGERIRLVATLSSTACANKFSRYLNAYDIVGLIRRPCPNDKKDAAYRKVAELLECTLKRTHPTGGSIDTSMFPALLEALQEHELGKPVELENTQLEEDRCRTRQCGHPKDWAGTCLHWAMRHPIQCDERR